MTVISLDRARLQRLLRRTPLRRVASSAVHQLGYAPEARMAAVQYVGSTIVYGYPNLSEAEVAGLLEVMEDQALTAITSPASSSPTMTTSA